MKKSLIALAALAATSAFAQSSVTLYGIVEATVDIGFNRKIDTVTTNSFTATNGLAVGNSPVLVIPTINAAGVLTPGAGVNGGTVVSRNELKNGFRVNDGNNQGNGASRVGFRGTEDLGGGMKAKFVLEMGINVDDGSTGLGGGNLFSRAAWGGLEGGFGEVRLGRMSLGSFAVQASGWSAGSASGLYDAAAGTVGAAAPMGGVRFSNAIRYNTPNFGGFSGSVALSAPETAGNTSEIGTATPINTGVGVVTSTSATRRTGVDLSLSYANGPAYIGFGYNTRDAAADVTSGFTTNNAVAGVGVANAINPGRINGWTLSGNYDLGVVKPFINYTRQTTKTERNDTFTPVAGGFASSITNVNDATARGWAIGLRAPVGAFTIITGYGRAVTDGVTNVVSTQNQAGAIGSATTVQRFANSQTRSAFQLGAEYALSKRTVLGANYGYARLQNNTDGISSNNFLASSGVQTIRLSDRVSALNVGMKHSF